MAPRRAAHLSNPHVHTCTCREGGVPRFNGKLDNLEIKPNFEECRLLGCGVV
jgi:hypothetical protein